MLGAASNDDLEAFVRHALLTTRATVVCPFHPEVIIRVGDDAAETHAYFRARNIIKSDGTSYEHEDFDGRDCAPTHRCGRRRMSSMCTHGRFLCLNGCA